VLIADFDFRLPEELIAQEPLPDRTASRMEHLRRADGSVADRNFREFPDLLRADDLVVFNNSRVFPARLFGRRLPWGEKAPAGDPVGQATPGRVEALLTRQLSKEPNEWQALVRPGRKIGVGDCLLFGDQGELCAEVVSRGEFGERRIRFRSAADFFAVVEAIGHIPLPPYIARADTAADRERYQTVYARERGSVAAPTAGLHFTPEILCRLKERGIQTTEITLHVGLGTFQPVRVENVEQHQIHAESYSISAESAVLINAAIRGSRRVVVVGTTTLRALEHNELANAGRVSAGESEADLFIYPGFGFQVAGALLTNFHLPQSTLLMLVCAFGGTSNVLAAYRHAVAARYRFYSYGDCMFVE
jgi:S-adenosylmethionine:tRNA ribosyltransferase-isomerase